MTQRIAMSTLIKSNQRDSNRAWLTKWTFSKQNCKICRVLDSAHKGLEITIYAQNKKEAISLEW